MLVKQAIVIELIEAVYFGILIVTLVYKWSCFQHINQPTISVYFETLGQWGKVRNDNKLI